MKEELANEMAVTLLNESVLDCLGYLFVLIFACVLAFLKTWHSEKAKYSAIKSSLDTIALQTEVTAKTTEKIKNDLEYKSWNRKEIVQLRRAKLEEYFLLLSNLTNALESEFDREFYNAEANYEQKCYDKINMIQSLYLPELANEQHEVAKAFYEFSCWISEVVSIKAEQLSKGIQNPAPENELMQMRPGLISELEIAIANALNKSKELAKALNT